MALAQMPDRIAGSLYAGWIAVLAAEIFVEEGWGR